jgi:anti-sigma regulatory factor (Ser/Thr protein kinase)
VTGGLGPVTNRGGCDRAVNQIWNQASGTQILDAAAQSVRAARSFLGAICADAQVPGAVAETALLLVSEVVTNAIRHGDESPVLDVEVVPDRLRVSVSDSAAGVPQLQRQDDMSEHGRGLLLVETLSTRWGTHRRRPVGNQVWFELDRD